MYLRLIESRSEFMLFDDVLVVLESIVKPDGVVRAAAVDGAAAVDAP
jgi:hypothetical protein